MISTSTRLIWLQKIPNGRKMSILFFMKIQNFETFHSSPIHDVEMTLISMKINEEKCEYLNLKKNVFKFKKIGS